MDLERILRDLGGPRALPEGMPERLEGSLIEPAEGGGWIPSALAGADVPRPLSPGLRGRLEGALAAPVLERRSLPWHPRVAAAVAAVVALVASVLVVSRGPADVVPRNPSTAAERGRTGGADPDGRRDQPAGEPALAGDPGGAPGGPSSVETPGPVTYAAPPFAFEGPRRITVGPGGDAPLRIGVLGGDAEMEAGFRTYLRAVNDVGGVRGRILEAVPVGPGSPAGGTLATVNLSGATVASPGGAPPWTRGPLLEGPTATEGVLRGSVFGLASAPGRQARLLADAVFPEPAPGAVAVIYRGTEGIYASEIPRGLRDVLRARRVTIVETVYDGDGPAPFVPADAAFLSLPREETLRFLDYAQEAGYRPPRAMGCVFPMLDLGLTYHLDEGYLVMSPYSLGRDAERRALEGATSRPPNTSTIHGWATAKALAVALWRTGADTPSRVEAAVRGLEGYDLGFAPTLGFRDGTNARTPEGLLYEVVDGDLVATGGFRTDPG